MAKTLPTMRLRQCLFLPVVRSNVATDLGCICSPCSQHRLSSTIVALITSIVRSNVATDLGWLPTVEALRVDSSGWDEMAQLAVSHRPFLFSAFCPAWP